MRNLGQNNPLKTLPSACRALLILFSLTLVIACADHSARTEQLLATDFTSLTNDQLSLYYYDLEDQIELVERRSSHPRINLGLGLGRYGNHTGTSAGVGVSTSTFNHNGPATNLRNRRNQVKLEMQKRGISP